MALCLTTLENVIGMVVLKANIEGAGFAISANELFKFLASHLAKNGGAIGLERNWYNSDGKGPVQAKIQRFERDAITVKRTGDDKEFRFEARQLCRADREFLRIIRMHRN